MEMEWNAKWDWENLGVFGSKAIENPKNLQLADWTIVDDGDIHAGSFNLSSAAAPAGGGGGSSASSANSSISAPTDSIFKLSTSDGKKVEMSRIASPTGETSVGSAEALLGLKLGKRTYFENSGSGGGAKSAAFSVVPTPSIMSTMKKTRSSGQNGTVCCQVEGCSVDLSLAKEYHRKHRVCDTHSKCPKVIVGGRERRFCQQCSRFHSLCEFDEKKRSCRRRLSDHNARRRKPQQETIQFNPSTPLPFYGGSHQQQMNFMALRPPPANSWNNSSSRFTLTKGCWLKSDDTDEQLRINGFKNPVSVSKGSLMSSLDAAPEYRRALSLLSTNSWSSCVPESIQLQQQQQLHENGSSIIHHHHHPMVHGIPEGVPFPPSSTSSELWPQHHLQSFKTPTPYDTSSTDFYSNVLN